MRRTALALSIVLAAAGLGACGEDEPDAVDSEMCEAARTLERLIDESGITPEIVEPAQTMIQGFDVPEYTEGQIWVQALERLSSTDQPILPNLPEVQRAQGIVMAEAEERCPTVGFDDTEFGPIGPATPRAPGPLEP